MKTIILLTTLLMILGGCDIFEDESSICDESVLGVNAYTAYCNHIEYHVNVKQSGIIMVKVTPVFFLKRCGNDERVFYNVGTKTHYIDSPASFLGDYVHFQCSAEIRNAEDLISVKTTFDFYDKEGIVNSETYIERYTGHNLYNEHTYVPVYNVTF